MTETEKILAVVVGNLTVELAQAQVEINRLRLVIHQLTGKKGEPLKDGQ